MKRSLPFLAASTLFLSLLAAWWVGSRGTQPVELVPTLTGEPEYCLTCHAGLPEISPSHPVSVFGCVICHGGERLSLDADLAHSTMRGGANPSDLSVVEASCGGANCHSGDPASARDHIQRVMTSVQSTYAGAIASIRYTFGAQPDLTARFGIYAVTDASISTGSGLPQLQIFEPSLDDNHSIGLFAANCLSCHINAAPRQGKAFERFTGCAACHSFISPGQWSPSTGEIHTLSTAISYTQCNTCHNRGNYDLRLMEFRERNDHPGDRLQAYYQPVAQFTKCEYTLDCADCHTRLEAMGDGDLHSSKKEIQYIRCETCHGTPEALPLTRVLIDPDDLAFRMAALNPVVNLNLGDTVLVTGQGEALWNTRLLPDGSYQMTGKATGQSYTFRPVKGSGCTQDGRDQSSAYCHTCHAVKR